MKYFQVQPGPRPAIQTAGQTRAGGGAAAGTPAPPEHRHHPEADQDPGRSGEYDEIFPEIQLKYFQVLTDRPTTTALQFENPATTTTARFTTATKVEQTAPPTFPSTVAARLTPTEPPTQPPPPPPQSAPVNSAPELIDLPDDSGLPPPAKAAPGPNGEEYYYYYYYYDEEEEGGEGAGEPDFSS